jgi:hypothetical protein
METDLSLLEYLSKVQARYPRRVPGTRSLALTSPNSDTHWLLGRGFHWGRRSRNRRFDWSRSVSLQGLELDHLALFADVHEGPLSR